MRFSQMQFRAPAILIATVLLLAFAMTSCGGNPSQSMVQQAAAKNVKCTKNIKVDPNSGDGVDHKAVYVCGDDTLEWDNPHNATFTVHFPGDCPFSPCPDITDSKPRPIKLPTTDLTVYKYNITVNGTPHDPHVVGGGY